MDDLIYLAARYTVSVRFENRSYGTSVGDIYLSAIAVVENSGRKLTASASVSGHEANIMALREEGVRGALANLRRQVEALEALK